MPRPTLTYTAANGMGSVTLFTLDLPSDIEKRLLVLAMHTGRTVQYCAREAILEYIDEVEERFLAIDRISEEESKDNFSMLD